MILNFLTGLSVAFGELRAAWLGFPPVWICDGCGSAFRTMHAAQWHEKGHTPICRKEGMSK
jgi:hypothetical protein